MLWRHRDFLRLWTGESISQMGTWASFVVIPLVAVTALHASTFQVGLLTTFESLAFLAIGLPAGAWCDRMRRRPIMIAADTGRALLLASVPVVAAVHRLTIWQLYAVVLASGALTVFFEISYQSYLPALVGREHVVDGNAKLEASRSVAQVAGPSLGGLLAQLFTAPLALYADAFSFLWSAVWVCAIRADEPRPHRPEQRHLRREIGEGLRYVLSHRILRDIAGCSGTGNLFKSAMGSVYVVFLVRGLHVSSGTVGLLLGIGSTGGILAAVTVSAVTKIVGQARMIWLSTAVSSPFSLLIPLASHGWGLTLFAAGWFGVGVGVVYYNVAQVSFRQALTPTHLLGRMNATMRFLVWGTIPLGGLLGGALGSTIGLRPTLWVCAVGEVAATLWVVNSPLLRMREVPVLADEETETAHPATQA
jgi:MFS family permease